MPKNIVFCADGTWDDPVSNSNVHQLYTALDKTQPASQLVSYDTGVGTDGCQFARWLGGGAGAGLFQKIKDGYSKIAAQYQSGDQLFLFGFSRGAYTARSLAGMIAMCGLPTINQTDPKCLDMAFEAYRNAAHRITLLDTLNQCYGMSKATIQLLGVWETVGSLGIPALFGDIDECQYGFLDTNLHPDVLNAVQALAIDEQRSQFRPATWTSAPAPNQSMTQVWFSGVHCDVGGGYPPDSNGAVLSQTTLLWMSRYASALGLQFTPGALPNPAPTFNDLATLHDSRTGAYRLSQNIRNVVADSCVASSTKGRCIDVSSHYAPVNLHFLAGALADTYSIVNV